jgi:4-hydroxy 2-oxovalerate aldolase
MIDFSQVDLSKIPSKANSLVRMYRIAAHKEDVLPAIEICESIKSKGYATSIQLMAINSYNKEDFKIKELRESSLDYIYFADSYGSLFPRDIATYINILRNTNKKIGYHAHNSLQLAFATTLEAINQRIDIVDGTIYGMGRGSGNLPLETLIAYLALSHQKYNTIPILDLIAKYFIPLQKKIPWGYSLPYMLSGILEIHPNYAKEVSGKSMEDIVHILETVRLENPSGFKEEIVAKIDSWRDDDTF